MSRYRLSRPRPRNALGRAAFTLTEILITIALIAGLAGLLVVGYDNIFGGAQADTARNWVNLTGKQALSAYRFQVGNFPTTAQGLNALVTRPADAARWNGPYIEGADGIVDPWGNPYQYAFPAQRNKSGGANAYDLFSYGPDGQEGGGDDITNWD
ncbi:MAG: type II secretion system major pseudopilin GspG [Opitutales bacterium]